MKSRNSDVRVVGGGLFVILIIALPLWREFHEPGVVAWNIFLAALLIGLSILAVAGQRYFSAHPGEIGEARFDTRNRRDADG